MHKSAASRRSAAAWKELDNADRYIRFAARVVLEHQDVKLWDEKALAEKDPTKAIHGLARPHPRDGGVPVPRQAGARAGEPRGAGKKIDAALNAIDFAKLSDAQKLDLIRVYHVLLNRFGMPTDAEKQAVLAKFDPALPGRVAVRGRRACRN